MIFYLINNQSQPQGSKLEAAATACENADQAAGRKRRPGKGNGKKCPTVEEIWNMIEGKMGGLYLLEIMHFNKILICIILL